ncbi:LysR family transcriptional regulator [Candidatus Sodalis sp. SoCistrobi]|uniref:LysR family transcriptional regulator n=1 Tax=Candidatus Sodalis sp. SoCistrobi TaxID=1922216 RepID=UPI00093DCE53|nr:LysR family transcriptional regulator [Candidatus Sodalis sp. SoCistrobi]
MPTDIRQMDLNLLKTLDVLLDERNVTRAAQRLALTQPAVSGMLTRLRDSFDDPLFVRTQRGIVPTLRALALAAPVKQLLGDVEGMLKPPTFQPATACATLTFAATDYALRAVVVPLMTMLRQQAPGIRVAVVAVDHGRLQTQFEQGDIDIALLTPETTPPDLHSHVLFQESYVCVMRAGHPDAVSGRLSLDRFCALDHALVSYSNGGFTGATDRALADLGLTRRVALAVNSFLVLPDILRSNDLIAIVPRRLARHAEGLVTLAPPLAIPGFSKTAVWHERTHRDPAQRWVRETLFTLSQTPD